MATLAAPTILAADSRATFLARTYAHLASAVLAFVLFETAMFYSGLAQPMSRAMLSVNWLWILGAFVLSGWLFSRLARSVDSLGLQYLGLAGYVLLEGLIFVPFLYVVSRRAPEAIPIAALLTLAGFGTLTLVVYRSRRDFTFLRPFLTWTLVMALPLIVLSALFGFHLGVWFSFAMVIAAGGCILHDTSDVLHHFPETHHVAAALELFASLALAFWYVLDVVSEWLPD